MNYLTRRQSPLIHEIEQELDDLFRLNDEDSTEVVLIRHAHTNSTDPDGCLDATGLAQARAVAKRLEPLWLDGIYTAPEQSCYETAQVLYGSLGQPIQVAFDLRDLQLQSDCGFEADTAWSRQRFLCQPRWDAIPAAESSRNFRLRAIQAVEKIIAAHPGRRVGIVTHSSLINAYLSMLLDIPRDVFFSPDHASISVVRCHEDLYAVRSINDTGHLRGVFAQEH